MQIALITDGGSPFRRREGGAWCERLVNGLASHEFTVYALTPPPAAGTAPGMSANVTALHVLPPPDGPSGRGARRAPGAPALARYRELVRVLAEADQPAGDGTTPADRFAGALYAFAETVRATGAPAGLPCSDAALRALEDICRAPGARPALRAAGLRDLLTAAGLLTQALGPLFAPWYEPDRLGAADLCHAGWAAPHLVWTPPLGAVAAVPALACLVHAHRALPRATAHHRTYA